MTIIFEKKNKQIKCTNINFIDKKKIRGKIQKMENQVDLNVN